MTEIRFDLGKNIVDTARASGVPTFSTDNIDGYISYSVSPVPDAVVAHYMREGFEVRWHPIFSLAMRADEKRFPDRRVQSVSLLLNDKIIKTHAEAQALVEQTIAQFQRGKWQRYYDPEWDVLLTGRSSLLNENGQFGRFPRTIDPAYKIPAEDWPAVVQQGPIWRWVGDGVLAQLSVKGDAGTLGLSYDVRLNFDLLDVALKRDAENLAQQLKEGDAKGWNSTAEHEADKKKRAALNKRLIENAINRGDAVVSPSALK
ncbi:hypothetical protein PI87_06525 [Ralstonia sp. A12]|uniref:hypothetical protein n=1 Tax=Ralstonia sp. A12 TaxID=1217052 RepID=UPI0005732EED|nr:hypothetical protein [Ralstonia sp. A12]KHK58059.1 hypothetical protein PI87_06525 [Ralstonia sp. A12]